MSDGQLQTHEGDGADTLSSSCTPVIFVPGVMGSRIGLSSSRTWDPDSTLAMLRWPPLTMSGVQTNRAALSVAATGSRPITELGSDAKKDISKNAAASGVAQRELGLIKAPSADQIQQFFGVTRNWASILWKYYGMVLLRLEGQFNATRTVNPVYAFGYDFRQSNAVSGGKLREFIGQVLSKHPAASRVIIVTHSMGGLVVRGAIAGDGGIVDKIRGVIHGAQPSNGAVVCYTRFLSGMMEPVESVGFWDLTPTVVGQTSAEYSYLMSGLPGPLQLLPNHRYQSFFTDGKWLDGLGTDADLSDIYSVYAGDGPAGLAPRVSFAQNLRGTDAERASQTVVNDFARHLATAKSFHEQLANSPNAAFHPQTVVLYSTGLDTVYNVRVNTDHNDVSLHNQWTTRKLDGGGIEVTDNFAKIAYVRKRLGDITVPDVSARCPAAKDVTPEVPAPGTEHGNVYKATAFNDRVVYYVTQLLQGPSAHAENEGDGSGDEMLASGDGPGGSASDDGSTEVAETDDSHGDNTSGASTDDDDAVDNGSWEAAT
jgi:PGAP1-like protein